MKGGYPDIYHIGKVKLKTHIWRLNVLDILMRHEEKDGNKTHFNPYY